MLKAAIIGTGRIASLLEKDELRPAGCSHAGAYSINPDTELVAGADIRQDILVRFGDDWSLNARHLYEDYREMLRRESVDIVSICAYAPQRLEMSLAALDAGAKGLWLEKALGCSIDEAEKIRDAVEKAKVAAVVDYPRRARAPFRKIKRLMEEKTYGRLQSVTCHMTHQLIHTGTHAFDVLRYWCGEALSVSGRLERKSENPSEIVDQGGQATIQMENGTVAFISAYRKKYYLFQFDLIFDNARILIGNDIAKVYVPGSSKLYTGFKELFEQENVDWGTSYPRDMLAELVHCIQTGESPLFSIDNAIESLRIALAIFSSDRERGREISPRSIDPNLRVENV